MSGTKQITEADFEELDLEKDEEEKELRALFKCLEDPRVRTNEDGTRTVTLVQPIKTKQREITEITFQIPKGWNWMETDSKEGSFSKAVALAASIAGLPIGVFERMEEEDFMLCVQVSGTMGKKLPTGKTS